MLQLNLTTSDVKVGGAVMLTSVYAGWLMYGSAVECRTMLAATRNKDEELLNKLMPLHWPYSKDMGTPVAVCAGVASLLAWDDVCC